MHSKSGVTGVMFPGRFLVYSEMCAHTLYIITSTATREARCVTTTRYPVCSRAHRSQVKWWKVTVRDSDQPRSRCRCSKEVKCAHTLSISYLLVHALPQTLVRDMNLICVTTEYAFIHFSRRIGEMQ